jgi:hypothetical protein
MKLDGGANNFLFFVSIQALHRNLLVVGGLLMLRPQTEERLKEKALHILTRYQEGVRLELKPRALKTQMQVKVKMQRQRKEQPRRPRTTLRVLME